MFMQKLAGEKSEKKFHIPSRSSHINVKVKFHFHGRSQAEFPQSTFSPHTLDSILPFQLRFVRPSVKIKK